MVRPFQKYVFRFGIIRGEVFLREVSLNKNRRVNFTKSLMKMVEETDAILLL